MIPIWQVRNLDWHIFEIGFKDGEYQSHLDI